MHFRKYISKQALRKVLANCPALERISMSRYASKRLSEEMLERLQRRGISIFVSRRVGRKPIFAPVAQLAERQICIAEQLKLVASGKKSAGRGCESHLGLSKYGEGGGGDAGGF